MSESSCLWECLKSPSSPRILAKGREGAGDKCVEVLNLLKEGLAHDLNSNLKIIIKNQKSIIFLGALLKVYYI